MSLRSSPASSGDKDAVMHPSSAGTPARQLRSEGGVNCKSGFDGRDEGEGAVESRYQLPIHVPSHGRGVEDFPGY